MRWQLGDIANQDGLDLHRHAAASVFEHDRGTHFLRQAVVQFAVGASQLLELLESDSKDSKIPEREYLGAMIDLVLKSGNVSQRL